MRSGCWNCPYCPQTYEEYCLSQSTGRGKYNLYFDAFSERATKCYNYNRFDSDTGKAIRRIEDVRL